MAKPGNEIFVGREEELQNLTIFAGKSFSEKAGVAFVTGEAGSGKTVLVEEFIQRIERKYDELVIVAGRCNTATVSYLPFQSMLENLLKSGKHVKCPDGKSRKVMEIVINTIWNVGPDLIGVFGIPVKALQTVVENLGLRKKEELPEISIPNNLDTSQVFGWYTKVMKNLSTLFPLILFIDDLHWADESSLNLLFHLARETRNDRILVIGTYRPHDANGNDLLMEIITKLGRYGAKEFSLDTSKERMGNSEKAVRFVHEYLTIKYDTNFSERFEQLLLKRTNGNALFVAEILRNLEEKGQIIKLEEGQGWWLADEVERIEDLPESIRHAVSERVDRLGKMLRDILDFASAEGNVFTIQVIARAKQIDELELLDILTSKLINQHRLIFEYEGKSLPNGNRIHEFSFHHNLIRDFLYTNLPKSKSEYIHKKIGDCLEKLYEPDADKIASKLAVHFSQAHNSDKAIHYCLKATKDANRRYGASEAVRFAKIGLEMVANRISNKKTPTGQYSEYKLKFLIELANAERHGGEKQEKVDHIQAGISFLEDNFSLLDETKEYLRAEVYELLGKSYSRKDNRRLAVEYSEKALDIFTRQDNRKNMAEILYTLGFLYERIHLPNDEKTSKNKAIAAIKKSLSIARKLDDKELHSRCLSRLAWISIYIDPSYAEQCALKALSIARIPGESDRYAKIKALQSIANVYSEYGSYKKSIHYLKKSLEYARHVGDIFSEADSINILGRVYSEYVTKMNIALDLSESGLSKMERIGAKTYQFSLQVGRILFMQGKWEQSKEYFRQSEVASSKEIHAQILYNSGLQYMIHGNYYKAESKFLSLFQLIEEYHLFHHLWYYTKISLNNFNLGKISHSRGYLEKAQIILKNTNSASARYWWCLYELAEIKRRLGELNHAKEYCIRSLKVFMKNAEDVDELLSVAEARFVMGKILVDMGSYQEAISYLNKAKSAFERCNHYSLGETFLYIGKALQSIGGAVMIHQSREYIVKAIAEFHRLELRHKEKEAQIALNMITS